MLVPVVAIGGAVSVLAVMGEDVLGHNGQATLDPSRLAWFVQHRPAWLVAAAQDATKLGAPAVLGLIAAVAAGALLWRGQRVVVAIAPGVALGATAVVVAASKVLVDRARPDLSIRLVTENEASFPSGHSADSAALLLTLAVVIAAVVLRRPAARVALVATAALGSGLIGLSRLVLAAHWPTDVIAGWALGTIIASLVATTALLAVRLVPSAPTSSGLVERVQTVLSWRRRGLAASTV